MPKINKLLDEARQVIRDCNYSNRTENIYIDWIYRYIFFNQKRHPEELKTKEISAFLEFLGTECNIAESTRKQAFYAINFLYKKVLKVQTGNLTYTSITTEQKKPVLLNCQEIKNLLLQLKGEARLMASLLYGSGLKLNECLCLRTRDIKTPIDTVIVRNYKGDTHRNTILPEKLKASLKEQIGKVNVRLKKNLEIKGFKGAVIPKEVKEKHSDFPFQPEWQYLFPSGKLTTGNTSETFKQHHRSESFLQKAIQDAVKKLGLKKQVCCYTFRHCFATHLLKAGCDVRIVQKLLGHKDIRTTRMYSKSLDNKKIKIKSPFDLLDEG